MTDSPAPPSLIEYPCDFPIKVIGPSVEGFAQEIARVVKSQVPGFEAAAMDMRASRSGQYLSLTCTVRVASRAELDLLYRALSGHPMVKVVL